MKEIPVSRVELTSSFWVGIQAVNASQAISHQWEQLVASGCIANFQLAAGESDGFRSGWFFADSDAYKWLDAASRVYALSPSKQLRLKIDEFAGLLNRAQQEDGYLFTYNQLHFPGVRWVNLQIEHELYCHGHLIEAGIAHHLATGTAFMLEVAQKAADLLVRVFHSGGEQGTPGHQEVEIALIRLYRVSGNPAYLDLAERFLERRGRTRTFWRQIHSQNRSVARRGAEVDRQRQDYLRLNPNYKPTALPPGNHAVKPPGVKLRFNLSALSGKYFQQHRPVWKQLIPVGHAVRYAYQQTALTMLARQRGDSEMLAVLQAAWAHMVQRRMYVTGGVGALPLVEGFGRDYELDPEVAYAETCAALASLYWNWEMTLATTRACYAELFEWQLYNAALVGFGLDGSSYLYNNPLTCRGGVIRRPWFKVPCCPSNLSRTLADIGRYIYSTRDRELWVHQYIGSRVELDMGSPLSVEIQSELPWEGVSKFVFQAERPVEFTFHWRWPAWVATGHVSLNGQAVRLPGLEADPLDCTASGLQPHKAVYRSLKRIWQPGDTLEIKFNLPVRLYHPHPRVRSQRNRAAITRGPLVYCLESIDNPKVDIFNEALDSDTLIASPSPELFGSCWVIKGKTRSGKPVMLIPFSFWGNRGPSQMNVMVRI
ncbi:MAG TPA: beta-L-arabinofuranosidase domain-containing protein [Anaerolineales bacterium]|nr:beta-L-arabinofuranosidase domain-containing protein [Anaerolineales bacterium]